MKAQELRSRVFKTAWLWLQKCKEDYSKRGF